MDTLKNDNIDYFIAQSIVKSYYIQLKLKGVEWVRAASAVLSGVAGSIKIANIHTLEDAVSSHVHFVMNYAEKQRRSEDEVSSAVLYATFNTFGNISKDNSKLYFNMEFAKIDGKTQVETIDITDLFNTPLVRENQWILLENEITIEKPDGTSSMGPGVGGWDEFEMELPM